MSPLRFGVITAILAASTLGATTLLAQDADQPPPPQQPRAGRPPTPQPPGMQRPERDMTPMHCEVTVFEVSLPTEKATALDTATLLPQSKTSADLQKALSALGTTKILHRLEQTIAIEQGARLSASTDIPYVTGVSQPKPSGETAKSISRNNVGVNVDIDGNWVEESKHERADVRAHFQLSTVGASAVEISEGVSALVFRKVTQSMQTTVTLGRPELLISFDAPPSTSTGTAIVTRIAFRAVETKPN